MNDTLHFPQFFFKFFLKFHVILEQTPRYFMSKENTHVIFNKPKYIVPMKHHMFIDGVIFSFADLYLMSFSINNLVEEIKMNRTIIDGFFY